MLIIYCIIVLFMRISSQWALTHVINFMISILSPIYIFFECHGLRGSTFIWHWLIKGELYVFTIIRFNFSFSFLYYLFDEIQKGGEVFGKLFMVCHSKLYGIVVFIGFCFSSKRGRLLVFLKSFYMFWWKTKEINQLTYSSWWL